jgi:tRNA(fMet)-specific endonuclease VapC
MGAGTGGHPIDAAHRGAGLERLILDATVLVTAARGRRGLENAIADDDDVAIAAVTVAELLVRIELAGARHRARGAHDLIIAATAISSERIVLTADVRGFEDLAGVQVRVLER